MVEGLDIPVAIFHGTADETVPLSDSLEPTGSLHMDVLLQTFQNEGHRFSRAAEQRLQDGLFDWLARL